MLSEALVFSRLLKALEPYETFICLTCCMHHRDVTTTPGPVKYSAASNFVLGNHECAVKGRPQCCRQCVNYWVVSPLSAFNYIYTSCEIKMISPDALSIILCLCMVVTNTCIVLLGEGPALRISSCVSACHPFPWCIYFFVGMSILCIMEHKIILKKSSTVADCQLQSMIHWRVEISSQLHAVDRDLLEGRSWPWTSDWYSCNWTVQVQFVSLLTPVNKPMFCK